MAATTLTQVVKLGGKVTSLSLKASKDLVCINLMCEKVTEACICRLERTLQKVDPALLISVDVSDNQLHELPPSFRLLTALEKVDISGNHFDEIPAVLKGLPNLKEIIR